MLSSIDNQAAPALTTDAFARAAALGSTVRLREDGSGLATSTWQRFKVRFYDLFRSPNVIVERQKAVISAFLGAAEREYGAVLAERAKQHLPELAGGTPLSSLAITSALADIAQRGGPHWIKNAAAIRLATTSMGAAGDTSSPATRGTRDELVDPILVETLGQAQRSGLISLPQARELFASCRDGGSQMGAALSNAIAAALHKAGERPDGQGYRALGRAEILVIGQAAVRKVLLTKINEGTYLDYLASHSPTQVFHERARAWGLERCLADVPDSRVADLLQSAFHKADTLVSPDRIGELFDPYFDDRQQRLAQIDLLGLPPERPATQELTALCIARHAPMSAALFAKLNETSRAFAGFTTAFAAASGQPDPQAHCYAALLGLGEQLAALIAAVNDIDQSIVGSDANLEFLQMAFDIHVARTPNADIRAQYNALTAPDLDESLQTQLAVWFHKAVPPAFVMQADFARGVMASCADVLDRGPDIRGRTAQE